MPKEYIDRDKLIKSAELCRETTDAFIEIIKDQPAADVREVPDDGIGEMSDGYHTFNGLYYQRMVLFAALVNAYNDKAWKSWKHEDGKPCFDGGWFIVGIDTPQGSYTYHYEDKYWNWFECEELPVAKHWDGHTEKDVTRLMSLDVWPVVHTKTENALDMVRAERDRQNSLWGDQSNNHPFEWISILGEEYGELCEAVNETCFQNGTHPERGGRDKIIKEAAHIAAVAVAIIEANCGADMREES